MSNEIREEKIGQFDQVRLLTVKNVKYLSAPPGTKPSTHGLWSVAGIVKDNELLLTKESVTIRIPTTDVVKVVNYDINNILSILGKLSHDQGHQEKESYEHRQSEAAD